IDNRNIVAAALIHQHGWPLGRVEHAVGVGVRDRPALRAAIDANAEQPRMPDAEQRLSALVLQSRDLHGMWVDATAAAPHAWAEADAERVLPEFELPADPQERMDHIVAILKQVKAQLAEVVAGRNSAARGVVEHLDWPNASVARIANTSWTRIYESPPA